MIKKVFCLIILLHGYSTLEAMLQRNNKPHEGYGYFQGVEKDRHKKKRDLIFLKKSDKTSCRDIVIAGIGGLFGLGLSYCVMNESEVITSSQGMNQDIVMIQDPLQYLEVRNMSKELLFPILCCGLGAFSFSCIFCKKKGKKRRK